MSLALRSSQDPRALVDTIQREVMAIDPEQPAYAVRTLEEILANSMARRRLSMLLLAVFSTVALLLAGVGICGVVAHSVSQRNHEIGIRRALGADTWQVLRLVLGHSLKMVLAGVVVGPSWNRSGHTPAVGPALWYQVQRRDHDCVSWRDPPCGCRSCKLPASAQSHQSRSNGGVAVRVTVLPIGDCQLPIEAAS